MQEVWEALWSPGPIRQLQAAAGPSVIGPSRWLSLLGDMPGVVLLYALARWRQGRAAGSSLLALFTLQGLVNLALWALVDAERPPGTGVVVHEREPMPSFPSGHTAYALSLWAWGAGQGLLPWGVPVLLVPAVGLARLVLGTHYVGDVLGGVVAGAFVLGSHRQLWPPLAGRLSRAPFRVWMSLGVGAVATMTVGVVLFADVYRAWQLLGASAGAAAGMLVDVRRGGERTGGRSPSSGHVTAAALVLTGLLVAAERGRGGLLPLQAVLYAAALLWASLGVPALVRARARRG